MKIQKLPSNLSPLGQIQSYAGLEALVLVGVIRGGAGQQRGLERRRDDGVREGARDCPPVLHLQALSLT